MLASPHLHLFRSGFVEWDLEHCHTGKNTAELLFLAADSVYHGLIVKGNCLQKRCPKFFVTRKFAA